MQETHLQVWSIIFSDVRAIALWQHHDLLLDVFDFIFGFFKVDYFYGNDLLRSVIDTFEHLTKGALADLLLFREDQLGVDLLEKIDKFNNQLFIIINKSFALRRQCDEIALALRQNYSLPIYITAQLPRDFCHLSFSDFHIFIQYK